MHDETNSGELLHDMLEGARHDSVSED
jgi:hypothetical protein